MNKLTARKYFSIVASILLLTDLVILLNIPFLRQIFGFLCFTTIPGLFIFHILKINKIEFLKKFILMVGLSVMFLMFTGLLVNSFYPFILKPLSLLPLLLSFNIILMILAFIAYKRNEKDFDINDVFNFNLELKDKLVSTVVFPILFPFMAVLGTHLMNTQGNNIILLLMLFLIPTYVVVVVILRDKIPNAAYPIAVWMIGMALVLMRGLNSYYITGTDIHAEYYAFRLALANSNWDLSNYYSAYNTCLSITVLPTIYKSLVDINALYIYKLCYPLIISIVPPCLYLLFKRYLNELYAFFSSIFFMSQFSFTYNLVDHARQAIAMLFFALAMMVFFDDSLNKLNKKILNLIFILAVIVSHYTTAYIFFILMFSVWFASTLIKNESKNKVTTTIITVFFIAIFFWYSQVTNIPFNNLLQFTQNTFINLGRFFIEESREEVALMMFGIGVTRLSDIINVIIHNLSFLFIAIGVLSGISAYIEHKNTKFDIEYLIMMTTALMLCASAILLPYVSKGYGIDRVYFQSAVLLSPAFVIGLETFTKFIRLRFRLLIIVILLVAQFFSGLYLIYQIFGEPHSPDLNKNGELGSRFYIYDQEVICGKWLNNFSLDNKIYSDRYGRERLALGYDILKETVLRERHYFSTDFFENNKTINDGYIYLRYTNVVDRIVHISYSSRERAKSIADYSHIFIGIIKIYDNGGAEVWR